MLVKVEPYGVVRKGRILFVVFTLWASWALGVGIGFENRLGYALVSPSLVNGIGWLAR